MCEYQVRVYNCGHYDKMLRLVCGPAKRTKTVCMPGNFEDASTSGLAWCGIQGCDKKPDLRREGLGKIFIL